MKMKRIFLSLLVLLCFLSAVALAQAGTEAKKSVLANGLRLILKEDHTSNIIALQTFIGTGVRAEDPRQAGIAVLTQRMLLKGTEWSLISKRRSEEEIFEEIENLGARIGVDFLPDMANLYLLATRETFEQALPIYFDVLLHPSFPEEELAKEKEALIKELEAAKDNNFNLIYENFRQELYGSHPYGRPDEGYAETMSSITRQDVLNFYKRYYVPNNIVVAVVGDFEMARMRFKLGATLEAMLWRPTSAYLPLKPKPVEFSLTQNKEVKATKKIGSAWMILGYPGPAITGEDYTAMKLLNAVIGGGMSSRLFTELREKRGLAYSTGSFFPSRIEESHFVNYIITVPQPDIIEECKAGILEILEEIKKNGVPEEELVRAKNYLIGNYIIEHETASRRAWYLGWYEMLGAGYKMDDLYMERIQQLTSEDLQRAAQRYFTYFVLSLLSPPAGS